jgi:chemotaxis protein CheY-P-specific phosphatase CheC
MSSLLKIVSAMMGGTPVSSLGSLEQSAISELANMICGNAMSFFSQEGISLDITPPTLIMGQQIEISAVKMRVLSVPRKSDMACNDCYKLHETEFHLCKDYLRSHPLASIKELSENTGITLQILASWINEGRIQVM